MAGELEQTSWKLFDQKDLKTVTRAQMATYHAEVRPSSQTESKRMSFVRKIEKIALSLESVFPSMRIKIHQSL